MATVKSIHYNWRMVGSAIDGMGDDYERFELGKNGVVSIAENIPSNGMEAWNYLVTLEDGRVYRIFNPNTVEYFPE